MKQIYLYLLALVLLSSCEKEEIIVIQEIEKEYTWKSKKGFEFEHATQLNSYATDHHLYTLGINSFTAMLPNSVTDSRGLNYEHFNLFSQLPITSKFPISAEYFISYTEKEPAKLKLSPTQNPSALTPERPTALSISLPALDKAFQSFNFISASSGESFAINSRGQALVPYQYFTENAPVRLRALLLDVQAKQMHGATLVDTVQTKKINLGGIHDGFLVFLKAVDENFFISPNYNETYRIGTDGVATKVLNERMYEIFKDGNRLYALGASHKGYLSTDGGLSWQSHFTFPTEMAWLTYTSINGKIIGYRNAQIFEITTSPSAITIKELDNSGLEGKGITSVSKFGDKVYVTTYSGVFYRDWEGLFTK